MLDDICLKRLELPPRDLLKAGSGMSSENMRYKFQRQKQCECFLSQCDPVALVMFHYTNYMEILKHFFQETSACYVSQWSHSIRNQSRSAYMLAALLQILQKVGTSYMKIN